jgi:hypothetical protein
MKKFNLIGFTLLAVLAFSVFSAAAASAEEPLWLLDETEVSSETTLGRIMAEGELEMEDMNAMGNSGVLCSSIIVGTMGPGSKGLFEEILNLKEEKVELECSIILGCESSTPVILVEPVGLPWETELMLEGEMFILLIKGKPGYRVLNCLVLGSSQEDECAGETGVLLENMPTESDVLGIYEGNTGNCTVGGIGQGLINGSVLIFDLEGLLLEVSQP